MADVYHLLSLLESDAAAQVASRASAQELAELEGIHAELEQSALSGLAESDHFFAINERFHMRLLAMADNRWRAQMVDDLRKVMKLNRHHSLLKTGRIEESLAEHRAIMAALRKRDATASMAEMQRHFDNGLQAAT